MPCWVAKLGLVWIMGQLSFGVKGDSYLAWIRTNLFLPWARTQSTLRRGSGGGGRTGKRTPMRGFEASAVPGRSAISVFFWGRCRHTRGPPGPMWRRGQVVYRIAPEGVLRGTLCDIQTDSQGSR